MSSPSRGVAIAVLLLFTGANPASAIFFPGVGRPSPEQLRIQEEESYWKSLPRKFTEVFLKPVGGLAVNLDYHYATQDFSSTLGLLRFESESELNTYSIRPEIVWTNWLSTYAIAGLHRGTNRSQFPTLNLDGWAAGAGVTAALGLPAYTPECNDEVTFDPFFVIPDFNWTHNEFDDIENVVNVINVTTRIGAGVRTDRFNWGLYAGPMYQSSTTDLRIQIASTSVRVNTEPKELWSGVIGSYFGVVFADNPQHVLRPTLLLTVEGGVGNRQGVLASLRYEYDFFK